MTKIKSLCLLICSLICLSLFACNDTKQLNTEVFLVETKNDYVDGSSYIDNSTTVIPQQENNTGWDAIGGSQNPYQEIYGVSMSGFLVVEGTFTKVSTYYDEDEQEKFYNALHNYDEKNANIPLMVYLIREMNITRAEYLDYLEAIDAQYTEELIDIIYSGNDNLINETFHSELTLYHEGEIYTVYDLAAMTSAANTENYDLLNQFPKEKLSTLLNSIQSYNEQFDLEVPVEISTMCNKLSVIVAETSIE